MDLSSPCFAGQPSSDLSSYSEFVETANTRFSLTPVVLHFSSDREHVWVFAAHGAQRCYGRPKVADLPLFMAKLNAESIRLRNETLARLRNNAEDTPRPTKAHASLDIEIDL